MYSFKNFKRKTYKSRPFIVPRMVLESLINPITAEKKPWDMFLIGFVYSTISIFLSLWIFQQYASLVMVFLTVIACVPLMYSTIKYEEQKDMELSTEPALLKEHSRALTFFMFLFFGVTLAYTLWYVVLPSTVVNSLFSVQTKTILSINNQVTGGSYNHLAILFRIFLNNLKVLIFCILFAFIYGVGAIFILVWNASVIGAAIGNFIRSNLAVYAAAGGLMKGAGYLQIVSLGILRYSIHGLPEILAYFTAGLAGGIISIAVIRHHFNSPKFERVILDSSDLIIIAVIMLVVAALMEVYVTPILI